MIRDRRHASDERRRAPRAPLVAAVLERTGARTELAQTVNIAPQGMTLVRVADATAHAPSTPIELRFQLPDNGELLAVRAEVVFDRPAGRYRSTGVRFAAVDPRAEQTIAAYVAAHADRYAAAG